MGVNSYTNRNLCKNIDLTWLISCCSRTGVRVFHENWDHKKTQKVSEYDQEIPQSQHGDRQRVEELQDIYSNKTSKIHYKQTNQLSRPRHDDCKTKKNIK